MVGQPLSFWQRAALPGLRLALPFLFTKTRRNGMLPAARDVLRAETVKIPFICKDATRTISEWLSVSPYVSPEERATLPVDVNVHRVGYGLDFYSM